MNSVECWQIPTLQSEFSELMYIYADTVPISTLNIFFT